MPNNSSKIELTTGERSHRTQANQFPCVKMTKQDEFVDFLHLYTHSLAAVFGNKNQVTDGIICSLLLTCPLNSIIRITCNQALSDEVNYSRARRSTKDFDCVLHADLLHM